MANIEAADALEQVSFFNYKNALTDLGPDDPITIEAHQAFKDGHLPRLWATYRAMITPAPHVRALRWKERRCKAFGGSPKWDAAIEADRRRLMKGARYELG